VASVRASVWDSAVASVRASAGDSVRDSVLASVRASAGDSVYGQHEAHWLAFYEYFREVCGLTEETEKLSGLTELAKSAGWALPHEHICWVSERPSLIRLDQRRRLHCEDGPAIQYPDGWAIYAIHGVRVPRGVIEDPACITVERIANERNTEVRRVMIDRYKGGKDHGGGAQAYMMDAGATLIDEVPPDHPHPSARGARLWRRDIPDDEPIVMVEMVDGTPQPDGGHKHYFERVHPELRPILGKGPDGRGIYGRPQEPTAINAIASRLGKTGAQYLRSHLIQT
jgi:hypothetical protein